jgi:hypothetical protein
MYGISVRISTTLFLTYLWHLFAGDDVSCKKENKGGTGGWSQGVSWKEVDGTCPHCGNIRRHTGVFFAQREGITDSLLNQCLESAIEQDVCGASAWPFVSAGASLKPRCGFRVRAGLGIWSGQTQGHPIPGHEGEGFSVEGCPATFGQPAVVRRWNGSTNKPWPAAKPECLGPPGPVRVSSKS